MIINKGPAPGFVNYPNHKIRITLADNRWIVRANNEAIADSSRAKVVEETGYDSVIYFPAADVSTELLVLTDGRTTCPFKGEARYFAQIGSNNDQPIAWTYPSVFDEVAPLKGYIAFYENRIELVQEIHQGN